MRHRLLSWQYQIRTGVRKGWRWLLTHCCKPLILGRKAIRQTFRGRIGYRTAFVIHASPPPVAGPGASEVENKVKELLQHSEKRFQQGLFFMPIADQIDRGGAVVTSRLTQGSDGAKVDHLIAIYPVE